jgi:hypothetical protein
LQVCQHWLLVFFSHKTTLYKLCSHFSYNLKICVSIV